MGTDGVVSPGEELKQKETIYFIIIFFILCFGRKPFLTRLTVSTAAPKFHRSLAMVTLLSFD